MSEKKFGRGRGRGARPNVSEAAPLPPQAVVDDLLKNAVDTSAEGMAAPSGNGVAEREEPTSSGNTEESLSPTASELKTALKHVSVVTNRALNPSAPAFTPSSSSVLNPNSTEFTPQGKVVTKQLPQSSALNPNSPEFVPSLKSPPLNVAASVFIPKVGLPPSMQNGDMGMGMDEQADDQEEIKNLIPQEEELPVLEPQDIVGGFEKVVEVSAEDQEGYDQLLMATAEMLLKATMYPGSFERLKLNITTTVQKWPPAESTLKNLGEMIIHWGISEPSLRYIACRVAQELCTVLGEKEMSFKKPLFIRLQSWYKVWKERFETEPLTEDTKFQFVNLSLFFAEVFVRVKVGDTPVKVLIQPIFEFIRKLLELNEDSTVTSACHMLKLTGVHLEKADDKGTMEKIIPQLRSLALDESLPTNTTDLVVRVIQLQARKWDKFGGSVFLPSAPPSSQAATVTPAMAGPVTSKWNTDAPPFVPSGELEIEFHYQQPVRNAEEWKDYFEGDDNDFTDQPDFNIEADDEGLDPEIELEMEAFIEEIEEHLMMRDFDPELDHSQQ